MGDIPTPRSFEGTLGDIIDAFRSSQGVQNLRVGGPLLSLFEAAGRSDARNAQDIFGLLSAISLDRATGLALDRIGADEKTPRIEQSPATGLVSVDDISFTKIASKVFQGTSAPIVGSVVVNVSDATLFPNTGSIYIGRGTPNYEGPLAYTSRTNNGTHWTLTLSSGTTRFHNTSESVIVAQGGNRAIGAGGIVRTPQGNISNAIEFKSLYSYTLPDGETEISNVQVVCQKPGVIGNVSRGDIREFSTLPFSGAVVSNPAPFSNGLETEKDDDYRERIKNVRASRQAGTSLAITTAVTGITATDENKRVSSASLVKRPGFASTLYIDDGTGYEDISTGIAMETLVDFATGGEQDLQTSRRPIARAFVTTVNEAPYTLIAGSNLTVKIGGVAYTHNFDASKFTSISNASAYEVTASINSDPLLGFLARTTGTGSKVVIFAKSDTNEDVQVVPAEVGDDANEGLQFPTGQAYTIQLYKNDRLLSKDGVFAILQGQPFSEWSAISGNQTLILAVDNTPALTYTFVDQNFVDAQTGFSTVAKNSVNAWCAVINAKIPGITATNDVGRIVLTSNAGPVSKAAVQVVGGTLVTSHLFTVGKVSGQNRDYTMDRNQGQIRLVTSLTAGDKLTLGSTNSRAFVESADIGPTTLTGTGKSWFIVDSEATIVPTGVTGATQLACSATHIHDWGHEMTLTASAGTPFTNVVAGDWLILWDPSMDASLLGAHRVVSATNTTIVFERRLGVGLRSGHATAALTAVGSAISKVLTTGGDCIPIDSLTNKIQFGATDTCEIFDPNTNLSTPVAPMSRARMWHTATLLANGNVLVAGGKADDGTALNSLEIYDPIADTWSTSAAVMTAGAFNHTATLLTNNSVLIAGGDSGAGGIAQFHVYNPTSDTMTSTGSMVDPRARHCAVKLPNDNVLVVGGYNGSTTAQLTAEIFSASGLSFTLTGPMSRARYGFGMAAVGTSPNKILVAGNRHGATGNTTYELYDIAGTTFGAETTIPGNVTFEEKNLVTLTNGHVVGLHGFDSGTPTTGAGFTYDGTTFTTLGNTIYLDTSTKWRSTYVEIKNLAATIKNKIVCVGGSVELSPTWKFQPCAQVEVFDEVASTWLLPDPAGTTTPTLTASGLVVVRSAGVVREIDIPVGSNYTASTLAGVLNADATNPGLIGVVLGPGLVGATASIYRTTKVRVSTNTFDKSGSISLVAQNTNAAPFQMATGGSIPNLVGHIGSVESNSELGTPDFKEIHVVSTSKGAVNQVVVDTGTTSLANSLVGLKDWYRGADGTSIYDGAAYFYPRSGDNEGSRTRFASSQEFNQLIRLAARTAPTNFWKPFSRAYLAAPFAMTSNDDLTVIVDQDIEKRYAVKMSRTLQTVGSTYAATNTFKDADGSSISLAKTFGLNFDFNDFAVHMPSRAVAFSADSTKSMLFRFYRLGPDGDTARVRFANPLQPNLPLSVSVDSLDSHTDVNIRLKSGALRTLANIHPTTTKLSIGQISVTGGVETLIFVANMKISTASRTSNVTTTVLTLPSGVTDHGLQVADKVWINSTDVNFSSGLKTVTARTSTQISYTETAANQGSTANIGTVSRDTAAEANFSGGSVAVGDFIITNSQGQSYRVSSVDAGGGWVEATSGDNGSFAPSSTGQLLDVDFFYQIFAGSAQTVTQIATAVNALAAAANTTCPVTITVLGSGSGTIDQSTPDFLGDALARYVLADGLNWVKTTTPPGTIAGDYQLTFKKPVTGALSTGSDWNHETVKLVPISTKNIVDWLNAPTVSGLFTVCTIQASDDGKRVQIASRTPGSNAGVQVQGGLANTLSSAIVGSSFSQGGDMDISIVNSLDVGGMAAGQWARVDNESGLPLQNFFNGIALNTWGSDGLLTFSTPIIATTPVQTKVQIEVQGKYIAISDMGMGAAFSGAFFQGSWIRIATAGSPTANFPQVSTANQGIYRVLRADNNNKTSSGTVWIENPIAIEERAECTVSIFSSTTPVPGDKLVVSDPAWGVDNQGVWTISAVGETTAGSGDMYANMDRLTVDISSRTPTVQGSAAALSFDQSSRIYPVEGKGATFVKKIHGIYPNQDSGAFANIRWADFFSYSAAAASVGSVITVLDKLNFPIDISPGIDAYQYNVGLIGEANRVVQGDPADTATYPGVAADGSRINISGPLVKRIKLALLLRVRSTGVTNSDIGDRVRSAVATMVNQSEIGEAIALSSVVAAASKVVGVLSVRILSPAYDAGNDLIPVQPAEKALVLSLDDDIQISYTSE